MTGKQCFALVVLGVLMITAAVAVSGQRPKPPTHKSTGGAYRDPDDNGGGGSSGPIVITRTVTHTIPAWNMTDTETYNITTDHNGITRVDVLDSNGNVIFTATRSQYDSLMAGLQSPPSLTSPPSPFSAQQTPPTLPPWTVPSASPPAMDKTTVTSIATVIDTPVTVVTRVHN